MMPELVDRRVLGAVRFLDATTLSAVTHGLRVESPDALMRPNRSGLWVIWNAKGLEPHTDAFDEPPAVPPIGSVAIALTVADLSARYLARSATISLPRDPSPANAQNPDSLFRPQNVRMYPAPNAWVSPGWALVRAHLTNSTTGNPLGGALVRVVRTSDQQILARGMSDARGEALVTVAGIPITTFSAGAGPALSTELDVNVSARFDPAAGAKPDPDAIESKSGLPSASVAQKLAAGRELIVNLAMAVP